MTKNQFWRGSIFFSFFSLGQTHQDITYHQISPIKMDIKTFFEALDLIQLSRSEEIVDKQCIKEQ